MTHHTPEGLPPLRWLTEEERATLHDNPNTADVEQLVYDYAREALRAQAASVVPVLEVVSWTNGSYHRNYKLNWLKDVDAGTLLYAGAPPSPAHIPADVEANSLAELADRLHAAGHEFWMACRQVGGGAVRWVDFDDQTLIVFTRGEYRDRLLANIGPPTEVIAVAEGGDDGIVTAYAAPAHPPQAPQAAKTHAYGGATGINDYLMTDGTIKAMRPDEVVWAPQAVGDAFLGAVRDTVARSLAANPGEAVDINPIVTVEMRKFMRDEPSEFDKLAWGEFKTLTALATKGQQS